MDVWDVQSRFKIQDGSNVRRLRLRITKGVKLMAVKFSGTSDPFVSVRATDHRWYRTAVIEKVEI